MNGLADQFQLWVEVGLREIFVIEGPTVGCLSSVKTFKKFSSDARETEVSVLRSLASFLPKLFVIPKNIGVKAISNTNLVTSRYIRRV